MEKQWVRIEDVLNVLKIGEFPIETEVFFAHITHTILTKSMSNIG